MNKGEVKQAIVEHSNEKI